MARTEQRENLQRMLARRGLSGAVLSDPGDVGYATGYVTPIEAGPSPFWAGPALAVVPAQGPAVLVLADTESAPGGAGAVDVVAYQSYVAEGQLDPWGPCRAALERALLGAGISGPVGVEPATLPVALGDAMRAAVPDLEFRPIGADVARLRAVKTADEIDRIRAAIRVCDVGQGAVKALARPGLTEIELFGAVRTRMESSAGRRLPLVADLVSGPRAAEVGGPPTARALQAGDAVLADLVPCVDGYWGDSCNTVVVGDPSPAARSLFRLVGDALEAGTAAIRPGLRADQLDAIVRRPIRDAGHDYPHHTGHGIGLSYHEEPRIVPGNERELEPGMVIALEPGVYGAGVPGLRLESVILVTPDGAEVLTGFRHTL